MIRVRIIPGYIADITRVRYAKLSFPREEVSRWTDLDEFFPAPPLSVVCAPLVSEKLASELFYPGGVGQIISVPT